SADEVGRELRGSEPGAIPFGHRFTLLLVTFFGHQIQRFLFPHISSVDALIENGVADRAKPHLQLLHLPLRSAVTLFGHHLLRINCPTLDESAALENCPHECWRMECVSMSNL